MTWVKIDDLASENEKLVKAGGLAAWLWACGLMYCNRQKKKTGFIPSQQVRKLYACYSDAQSQKLAAKLVDVGLWEPTNGGFRVHDYGEFQPLSVEQQEQLSASRSEAGRRGGKRSGESRRQKPEAQTIEATCLENGSNLLPENEANNRSNSRARADARRDRDRGSGREDLPEIESEENVSEKSAPVHRPYDVGKKAWATEWLAAKGAAFPFRGALEPRQDRILAWLGQQAIDLGQGDPEATCRAWLREYFATDGHVAEANHPLNTQWLGPAIERATVRRDQEPEDDPETPSPGPSPLLERFRKGELGR